MANISTQELSAQLDNPEFAIVDIRSSAAYNGWKMQGEARGGHIRGAISYSLSWIKNIPKTKLISLLTSKGITSKKFVSVYGYASDNCSDIEKLLLDNGTREVFTYAAGLQEWADCSSLPMDTLANYKHLVPADWVSDLIAGHLPNYDANKKFVLIEVSWRGLQKYEAGHIPGAIHLDVSAIENPVSRNKYPDEKLLEILLGLGITCKSLVVLYGRDIMAAARAASILMYAGVEDVRVLDGGLSAWLNSGNDIVSGVQQPIPATSFGGAMPGNLENIVGIDSVKEIVAGKSEQLVSVQSWPEFIGETSGYSYIKAKGHIPGSIWGHSGSDPHHMQDYRNPDNTMRAYHEIASNWDNVGITSDKKVVFYCGTGWRASEAFFYAHLMGRKNISVYDGGWHEWSKDISNPIEPGPR